MRAFTLLELTVTIAIIGVLSALAMPSIADAVRRSEGEQAVIANAAAFAGARDAARGFGVCLDYVLDPPPPGTGPYVINVFTAPCPDDADQSAPPVLQFTRVLSPLITDLKVIPIDGGCPPDPVARVRFNRDGSIYDPLATLNVEAVVGGQTRHFLAFPAAGTIAMDQSE